MDFASGAIGAAYSKVHNQNLRDYSYGFCSAAGGSLREGKVQNVVFSCAWFGIIFI